MKPKSILNFTVIITASLLILFQLSSCGHLNHQNFHKQKYLKGKLKSVYTEDSEKDISSINSDSVQTISEPVIVEKVETESGLDEPHEFVVTDQPTLAEEKITEEIFPEPKKAEKESPLIKKIKKSPLTKLIIPSKKQSPTGGEANLFWFVILAALGLIALPFAFLIGFWAFVISFVLLTLAGIILLTGDYDNPWLIIVIICFFVLLCIAAAIALVWFIIWGIIQLVN